MSLVREFYEDAQKEWDRLDKRAISSFIAAACEVRLASCRAENVPTQQSAAASPSRGYGISSDTRCKIGDADGGGDNLVCGWEGSPTEPIKYASSQMATALARRIVTGIKLRLSAK
jgi:hypothetical protein